MSEIITIERDLPELARRINEEHRAAGQALRAGLTHARNAGELLLEAKEKVRHGEWLPWLRDNCEVAERTAQTYMQVARNWPELESKAQRVADLSFRDGVRLLAQAKEEPSTPAP